MNQKNTRCVSAGGASGGLTRRRSKVAGLGLALGDDMVVDTAGGAPVDAPDTTAIKAHRGARCVPLAGWISIIQEGDLEDLKGATIDDKMLKE